MGVEIDQQVVEAVGRHAMLVVARERLVARPFGQQLAGEEVMLEVDDHCTIVSSPTIRAGLTVETWRISSASRPKASM